MLISVSVASEINMEMCTSTPLLRPSCGHSPYVWSSLATLWLLSSPVKTSHLSPSCLLQLTPGGKAAQAGVGVGDWVVSIGDTNAEDMTHVEAQNTIRAATDSLTLTLSK